MKTEQGFLNDLYSIQDTWENLAENKVTHLVALNPSHGIFNGHFPGNPVLPGVCTVQIVKELLAHYLKNEVLLKKAGTIKYLSFINPQANRLINFEIQFKETDKGRLTCSAKVFFEATVFCSFKGEFEKIP